MTYIVLIWSCALGQPLCTHPDATWSGREFGTRFGAAYGSETQAAEFLQANPGRQVVKFEVMTKERYEFERGSYNCSQMGAGE